MEQALQQERYLSNKCGFAIFCWRFDLITNNIRRDFIGAFSHNNTWRQRYQVLGPLSERHYTENQCVFIWAE